MIKYFLCLFNIHLDKKGSLQEGFELCRICYKGRTRFVDSRGKGIWSHWCNDGHILERVNKITFLREQCLAELVEEAQELGMYDDS